MKVFKFKLPQDSGFPRRGVVEVRMPKGAQVLSVGVTPDRNAEDLVVWAFVDPSAWGVAKAFEVVWTGDDLSEQPHRFIGTAAINGLVYHVFELE